MIRVFVGGFVCLLVEGWSGLGQCDGDVRCFWWMAGIRVCMQGTIVASQVLDAVGKQLTTAACCMIGWMQIPASRSHVNWLASDPA